MVCVRPGGIPAGAYLGAYCGELYPGWRWFEKEVAAQAVRRDVRRDDEVPVFYNAVVEREPTDPRGYDALFIDGMVKGSILTRASHSCDPNAAMRVRVRDEIRVEMWTVRAVTESEEICWDYQCRTDSEEEIDARCAAAAPRSVTSSPPLPKRSSLRRARQRRGSPAHSRRSAPRVSRRHDDEVDDDAEKILANAGFKGPRDAPGILAGLRVGSFDSRRRARRRDGEKIMSRATVRRRGGGGERAEDAADDETKVAGSGSGADTIVDLPRLRAGDGGGGERRGGASAEPRGDPR